MRRIGSASAVALLLAGCGGRQSTLEPKSHASREVAHLWWVMFAGAAVVFAVVVMLLVVAVARGRSREQPAEGDTRTAKRLVFFGGFAIPLAVLIGLFALILETLPAVSAPRRPAALTVEVTGRQWFWNVRYPGTGAVTANEIHIPVRTAVELRVRSGDVIHSLWVPELNRKIDMIPGRTNSILLRADEAGVYRGQCAEFCGVQHANMAFLVVAEPPARFSAWLRRESQPAQRTSERGARVFEQVGCSGCHAIRGTGAAGDVGPDLTHLAGRQTLAADTIPNSRGDLAGWILDPQHVKPGNKMPGLDLTGDELQALLDYLEGLK
jgi:cytochrome c oxidase subunit II